jgi:signal transduction histidine kinase
MTPTTLSFKKAAFIAFLTTIIYVITVLSQKDLGGYGGLFLLSLSPLAFLLVIIICYLETYLERKQLIAPHIVFRFLTLFLSLSFIAWLSLSEIYIGDFQQYTFGSYMWHFGQFALDFILPIGIATILISSMLSSNRSNTVKNQ